MQENVDALSANWKEQSFQGHTLLRLNYVRAKASGGFAWGKVPNVRHPWLVSSLISVTIVGFVALGQKS